MMLWRMIRYELKRSLHFYIVWAALAMITATLARMHIFSLTDMPLFYLMFFGSVGIMLYRYYNTMHGSEAAFLFTVDLSPKKQMIFRYCSALILSAVTALLSGLALRIQGEDIGKMIQGLSFPMGIMLTAEVSISAFALFIEISSALTLSNIRPFSKQPVGYFVMFGALMIGINTILPMFTEKLISAHLVVTANGEVLISTVNSVSAGISFSLNTLVWNIVYTIIVIFCIPLVIRRKLLITK